MHSTHSLTPRDRAKLVLDICAYDLKDVEAWVLANLEVAIEAQINEALADNIAQGAIGNVRRK